MRQDIDEAIETAVSYEDFLTQIREKGYEVKGEKTDGEMLKYISFKAPGQQRFIRGSVRSLGEKYTKKTLIDTSEEKFRNSPGLKHWADIQNLKTAAASYAVAGNLTELKEKIEAKNKEAAVSRSELAANGRELKELKEIQHYLLQYKETAPYRQDYNNSRDKETYAMKHDEQLTIFDGARNMLKKKGIRPNISELKQVNRDVSELEIRQIR